MSVLIFVDHNQGKATKAGLCAVNVGSQVAAKLGVPYNILLAGTGLAAAGAAYAGYGAAAVLTADQAELKDGLAEYVGDVVLSAAKETGAAFVVGIANALGKAVLPRVANSLGAGMVSDIVGWDPAAMTFDHPYYAGKIIATLAIETPVKVVSIRAAAFEPMQAVGAASPVKSFTAPFSAVCQKVKFKTLHASKSERPDLTEASIIVSGGRGVKDFSNYEQLIFPLADMLKAAVGTTRSVVDAGILPNDLQVGQTGKIVAPDLYMAIGISGAIQHLAGMKDSKTIVAINKDEEAPIFNVADYGLVGDLFKVVPELMEKIKAVKG